MSSILKFILLVFLGFIIYGCSGTQFNVYNEPDKAPREFFYDSDSSQISKYVYKDNKFCFFTENDEQLMLHSIRTDQKLENNTLYHIGLKRYIKNSNIDKEILLKLSDSQISEINEKLSLKFTDYIKADSLTLLLSAKNQENYLYYVSIPTIIKKSIQYQIDIYAILDKTKKINSIYVYQTGDKRE